MGAAFHQLCPRYSGTLIPTAPTAIRLWETFTVYHEHACAGMVAILTWTVYPQPKEAIHVILQQLALWLLRTYLILS